MRLIRCYIENFGGLSQYRMDFDEGLTTIQAENGFGKTTLAEFIRAMFYGFPRAVKALEKNPRKKYTPWGGGAFGGYLIFEHEGKRYRISRRFGATPKGDTFELTDEVTHRKSGDFTADIGRELFGLDPESFERSTYLPQLPDRTTIATTGIQSKLGDLVQDTGDINNFDRAIQKLKEKRSACIPYRGKGGTVAEAQNQAAQLQEQIDRTEALGPELEETLAKISEYTEERDAKSGARDAIRQELLERSRQDAKRSAEKQLKSLADRTAQLESQRQTLLDQYPKGLPPMAELQNMEAALRRLEVLAPQPPARMELEARETVRQLAPRFAEGVPDETFFDELRGMTLALTEAELAKKNAALTEAEQTQLDDLAEVFADGVPTEEELDRCREQLREHTVLTDRLSALAPEEPDRLRLEQLKVLFARGIPEETELEEQQSRLDRISALRQENQRITALAEDQARSAAADRKLPLPMLLDGVLVCIGIVLLVLELLVPGIVTLVLGGVLLAVGFAGKLKQDVARQLQGLGAVTEDDRQRLRDNARTIDELEQQVRAFTLRYRTDALPLQEQLSAIRADRARYLELSGRCDALQEEARRLRDRLRELSDALTGLLGPHFADRLPRLERERETYLQLQEKRAACQDRARQLEQERSRLCGALDRALGPYFPGDAPGGYGFMLRQLEQEVRDYTAAVAHLAQLERQNTDRDRERKALREKLTAFAGKYALAGDPADPTVLDRLREDVRSLPGLEKHLQELQRDMTALSREHRELLELPDREDLRDPAGLQLAEEQLTDRLRELEQELAALDQHSRSLRSKLDGIPQLRDELERQEETARTDAKRAELLDHTVALLEQARQDLSDRYMGTVQSRFLSYMDRICGEDPEKLQVTAELEVRVERLGEHRPLEYFSAGQTDLILLCMRLALADALFREGQPFLILDDPFVNLDDRHTKRALEVLQELSKDHQILYLVCNSSRVPT